MMKRQRCDYPAWWSLLRDDVVSNGGFVHPHLEFSETNRSLTAKQKILKGEVVLRIPTKNFMTKDRAFSMCHPWLEDIITAGGTNVTWKNSTADLAIAIALASCSSPDSYMYLHSLPESSSFDALPRRWSEKDIQNLLTGTSLLRHVISAKTGAMEDYRLLLERYRKHQMNTNKNENASSFPSFEKFSDMLAAVTSRAFQIGTTDEDIAIVPILDLGNHTRGKSTSKLEKKNVSYQYDVSEDVMIVTSTIDIDLGESIRLTYGAKSNAQLLLNYGFCIPRNLEPDGSSNDNLEFRVLSSLVCDNCDNSRGSFSGKCISLRAGPKSYSYGGFAATLEEYFTKEKSSGILENGNENNDINNDLTQEEQEQNGNPPDLEDFMNQCEDEDENGDDFVDLYEGNNSVTESAVEDHFNTEKIHRDEMEALRRFKLDLIKLSKGYNNCKGADIPTLASIKPGFSCSQLYSTILSMSELRTIYFFVRTIDKVQNLIYPKAKDEKNPEYSALDLVIDPEDLDMIDKQTDDLASTYMSIRHGGF
jgi:hypothetical protein